ncbi:hypothetical protein PHISP_03438 [Aspergillus sp. HF37]|nr:hypothetical protein PHISP_03438 [Aspergillus sp. HF37]
MKLTGTLLFSSLLALAAAQDLSQQASCASDCGVTDVCCMANCYNMPCPSDSNPNKAAECVSSCPTGDPQAYADCQHDCYNKYFWQDGTSTAAQSNNQATATGSEATSTGTGSDSGSSTATGTGAAPSNSDNAGAPVKLGASAAGLMGLIMAALVL